MKNRILSAKGISYGILFAVFAISVVCRLIATADSHVIPGLGSMYYPLQVRCLLERGTLGYSDVPLVFWMEALVAKIIILFSSLPVNQSIVLACRLVNATVPSLIVVPVFFLAKSISGNSLHPAYMAVILGLSVLNPSVLVLFAIDFDKNAISMLFVYMTLYYLWQYIRTRDSRIAVMTVLSVLLTLLTHFGCFSVLFAFLLIFMAVTALFNRTLPLQPFPAGREGDGGWGPGFIPLIFEKLAGWLKGARSKVIITAAVLIALILLPFLVRFYDTQRFIHLSSFFTAPLQLFRHSFFLLMLRGEFIYDWPNMTYLVIINSFSVLSVITWFRLRKRMRAEESAFLLSVVLWFVFLSNPFMNTAIYNRLLFISLIPLTVVIIFVLHYFRKPVKITISVILALLLILTVATSGVRKTYISKEEYTELKQVGKFIPRPSSTIVLAQHRLEFWTSWTLRMKSGQLRGIRPEEYPKYSQVLYIVQKSNSQFQEEIPKEARLIRAGRYFNLYRIR